VTGLKCFEVWAAPFDVLYELVAAKAAMIENAKHRPAHAAPAASENDRYAHYPPGVRLMIAKLQGRAT
jgi:hypothetical protein